MRYSKLCVVVFAVSLVGCFNKGGLVEPESPKTVVRYKYAETGKPAVVPPGVVRMCWDEPKVSYEKSTPGLDTEGHWYHPYYVSIKEAKSGKWRPCSQEEFDRASGKMNQ